MTTSSFRVFLTAVRTMSRLYQPELAVAIRAVREAARLCRAVGAEISSDVLAKKDKSPVTVADYGSQALICDVLAESFPDDPVIAEEDSAELRLRGKLSDPRPGGPACR